MPINVMIVDDHQIVADGLKLVFSRKTKDIEVVAVASNGEEAMALSKTYKPDLYIIDISLPIMNGIELTGRLKKMYPESKVIILSMHDKRVLVEKAFEMGAKGYVLKESDADEIIQSVYKVFNEGYFLSSKIAHYFMEGVLSKKKAPVKNKRNILTKREREIVQLIAEGYTTKQIAEKLKRSENTIHVHRVRAMKKLKIHNQADLTRFALKESISFI